MLIVRPNTRSYEVYSKEILDVVNSASDFEFKLSERAPCDGDEILVGASRVKGT